MSKVTQLYASFPAASSASNRIRQQSQSVHLTAELRAGLDALKEELQAFLKSEERQ